MDHEPDAPPIVDADAARRAAIPTLLAFLDEHDAACPECGYPLRGLSGDHCPECGWAIRLRPADGIDRGRVVRMARWVAWFGLLMSSLSLLQFIVFTLLGVFGGPPWGGFLDWRSVVYECAQLIVFVISIAGLITLGKRSTALPARIVLRRTKRVVLGIVWVLAISAAGSMVLWMFQMFLSGVYF